MNVINDQLNNNDGIESQIEIQLAAMKPSDIILFRIPIHITIDEYDSWNDIHNKLMKCVSRTNLYDCICSEIIRSETNDMNAKLTEMNSIREDYDLMLSKCLDLINAHIH